MGAQADEPVLLEPPAPAQHLGHRRAQVVVADEREDAAEEAEGLHVRLEEGLLRLPLEGHDEGGARVAGAHQEEVDPGPLTGEFDLCLAPVDLRFHARVVHLRHEDLVDRIAQLAPPATHVLAHRRLGDAGAVLVAEALPDPFRGVPLLARRLPVREQPLLDQRPVRPQLRRPPPLGAPARRRPGRGKRLTHGPAMDAVAARQLPDRQPLPLAVPTDPLEQLHPRSHPLCDLPLGLRKARTVEPRSDGGGAKSGRRSGAK